MSESVCLIATSQTSDKIFMKMSLVVIKFWKSSESGSGSKNYSFKEFLPSWIGEIQHTLPIKVVDKFL